MTPNEVAPASTLTCEDCRTITLASLLSTDARDGIFVRSGTVNFQSDNLPPCPVCRFLIGVAREAQEHKMRSGISDHRYFGSWPLGPRRIGLAWENCKGRGLKYDIVNMCVPNISDHEVHLLGGFDLVADSAGR